MSVHSEYGRALESLIACLRALDRLDRDEWLERLTGARVDRNPDLSTGARSAMESAEALEGLLDAEELDAPPLRDALAHLRAHCRIVLGIPH